MLRLKRSSQIEKDQLLFSNKKLRKIIVPLLLSQILSMFVGMIDTIMVAYAGETAVAGVSLVNSLDVFLLIFFTSTIAGGAVVLSQSVGKKNYKETCESAKQLVYIVTMLATILLIFVSVFRKQILTLLFGDAEESIMQSANDYFFFLAFSYPFVAIRDSIGACFRSSGNTKVSLVVSIILNCTNIVLNAIFIMGCNMGAAGAALATLIARIIGAGIMVVLILQKKHLIHIEKIFHYKPDFSIVKKIMRIGIPNGIENAMFQFGRLMTQSLISTMGKTAIAANAVALNICNFQYMTGGAFSAAMITVVGICIGAKEYQQAKYYSRKIMFFEYIALWTVVGGTFLFINPLLSLYSLSAASAALAKQLIFYHGIVGALIWPLGFVLNSVFRAAGDVRFSMVVSMSTMWIFRVFGGYVCALESVSVFGLFSIPGLGMGIYGVWLAMTIDWVFRCTLYLIHYIREKWLDRKRLQLQA